MRRSLGEALQPGTLVIRRADRYEQLLERVDAIAAERDRVVAGLADQGWTFPDAQGNFVWLPLGDRTADFTAAADLAGVMVRPFHGEGCRVSIGEPAGNDVLLQVAAGFAPDDG